MGEKKFKRLLPETFTRHASARSFAKQANASEDAVEAQYRHHFSVTREPTEKAARLGRILITT